MIKNNSAIILARAGSKGIPGKNWIDFSGFPLICWSIFAALENDCCETVIVSSDSREIRDICNSMNDKRIIFLPRPENISGDKSPSELAISHALSVVQHSDDCRIAFLQPTSPFRHGNIISKCFDAISRGESSFTVTGNTPLFWSLNDRGFLSKNYASRKMRQEYNDNEIMWHDCGNAYCFHAGDFALKADRHFGECRGIKADYLHALQIDSNLDLELCRKVNQIGVVCEWMSSVAKSWRK
jgi:N-acylneuraminate cytidylyltransferase